VNTVQPHITTPIRKKRTSRSLVPAKHMLEQIHRLGLSQSQLQEAIGMAASTIQRAQKHDLVPKSYVLAVEALVRRQSRDATNWALLCLTHGSAQVTLINEPQEISISGKPFWLIEKPGNGFGKAGL
jgi:hypothetical protein